MADVKPGMKGYGLTVVKGFAVERFGVEVVGVVRNASAGRSTIVAELSGLGLEETGVVAGMSGSPVYLDGKLAGAVSSGWGFSKRTLAGITPAESMVSIVPDEAAPAGKGAGPSIADRAAALARLASTDPAERTDGLRELLLADLPSSARPDGGGGLLSFVASGLPPATVEAFREPLSRLGVSGANLSLLGSGAAGTGDAPVAAPAVLAPGDAVTAYLVRGDLNLGATGTVTEVFPDGRFVAFGHPFLGAGELELPVAPAEVIGIVPSLFQSFKLANGGEPRYRLTSDRDTGVGGRTDRKAGTVPVTVVVEGEGRAARELRFEIAASPKLLPVLAGLVADAAMNASDPTPRDRLLAFRIALDTAAGEISYADVATGTKAREAAVLTTVALAAAVADNDLADARVNALRLRFSSAAGERRLRIVDAALSTRKVRPGESLAVAVRLADWRGAESVRVLRLAIPEQTPDGRATLVVADGSNATALRQQVDPSEPRTLEDLAGFISRIVPGNRLFAGLLVAERGAATRSATLPAVPPTALSLLAGSREQGESGLSDIASRLVAEESVSFDRPVSGSVRLDVDVERARPRGTR